MSDLDQYKGTSLPPQTVVVERGAVSNFAAGVTDHSAVFRDPRAATEAGFDAIPAPPTFPFVMSHWGAFPEVQPEGADQPSPIGGIFGELLADGGLLLHGEESFEYSRPVVVGDVLTSSGEVTDVYVKETSSATMTFVETETTWVDEDGDHVVTVGFTAIIRK